MTESNAGIREVEILLAPGDARSGRALASLRTLAAASGYSVRVTVTERDPELAGRYGAVLPVVRVGGVALLSGCIRVEELRAELERAFGPAPLAGIPPEEAEFLPVLRCPVCAGPLEGRPRAVACLGCDREYPRRNGVLHLLAEPEEPGRPGLLDWVLRLISFRLPE